MLESHLEQAPQTQANGSRGGGTREITPIFLLATPRSGSTLVQRVLGAYEGVATVAEPWLLLPPLLPLRDPMPLAIGWYHSMGGALQDFVRELPDREESYRRALRSFALDLYREVSPPGTRWFLDKTPPYHLIAEDVIAAFPDAKFIFLWRNPLSVLASTVETFCGGRWRADRHRGDLFDGVANLVETYEKHSDRVFAVRYEDLLSGDPEPWSRMAGHIGLDFDPHSLERFTEIRFNGTMGDPTGRKLYDVLEPAAAEKWKQTICNPLRREWAARYLRWIGRQRLATMGYDLDALLAELRASPVSRRMLARDMADSVESLGREVVRERWRSSGTSSAWRSLARAGRG
jgi:Sulfotransferase family